MMPGDYEDHPEWDDMDTDIDDYNTSLYTALDALEAADDFYGDYEHSLDYPDLNGMDSSLVSGEEDDRDSSSSSGAASTTVGAVSAIARSFVMLAVGAALITGSYQKSLGIRNGETGNVSGTDVGAGIESSDDGDAGGDSDRNSEIEADGENVGETSHNFRLVKTSREEGAETMICTYVCDNCGKEIIIEVNVGSKKKSENKENEKMKKSEQEIEDGR